MTLRQIALKYAYSWLGRPYRWGGDDPSGIDCSGLIVEILQGVGLLKHGTDYDVAGLIDALGHDKLTTVFVPGALVCYHDARGIYTHVGMLTEASGIVLQAAGGGSATQTVDDAWRSNAFVKLRPVDYRKEAYIIIDPFVGTD